MAVLCLFAFSTASHAKAHHKHQIRQCASRIACVGHKHYAQHKRHHRVARVKQTRKVASVPVFDDSGRWPSSYAQGEPGGVERGASGIVGTTARFIRGRLVCALNVNAALAARGIRGTGSALAKSFLGWGQHVSHPVPGAVAVFNRRGGGHVAIVDHVSSNGVVYYLNPSSRRQAWQVGPYNRRPIAFRMAS